ncbi:MAG: hypothetical protein ACIARR_13675 [Phycisphaerales bacterium JB059]
MTKKVVLSVAMILLGLAIAIGVSAALFVNVFRKADAGVQFIAPGEVVYDATSDGAHDLWIETRGVFEGQPHSNSGLPDDATLQITPTDSDQLIPWHESDGTTTDMGATSRRSFATFDAPEARQYVVSVQGDFEPRVFYVGPSVTSAILATVFGSCASLLMGLAFTIGGVVLLIVTLVRGKNAPTPPTPA